MLQKYLQKDNLHHAYLVEGAAAEVVPEIKEFLHTIGIETVGNSDCIEIHVDSFRIDDARNLSSFTREKSFSDTKKVFLISANNFLLEAQNSLLKLFEEPTLHTHFFLVVPDARALLPTFLSRFYFISTKQEPGEEIEQAGKFIEMPLRSRVDFIKEFLTEEELEDDEGGGLVSLDSPRARALRFLDALEASLHAQIDMSKATFDTGYFEHIFKVREILRMPGSAPKMLLESVALLIPNFKK